VIFAHSFCFDFKLVTTVWRIDKQKTAWSESDCASGDLFITILDNGLFAFEILPTISLDRPYLESDLVWEKQFSY